MDGIVVACEKIEVSENGFNLGYVVSRVLVRTLPSIYKINIYVKIFNIPVNESVDFFVKIYNENHKFLIKQSDLLVLRNSFINYGDFTSADAGITIPILIEENGIIRIEAIVNNVVISNYYFPVNSEDDDE